MVIDRLKVQGGSQNNYRINLEAENPLGWGNRKIKLNGVTS